MSVNVFSSPEPSGSQGELIVYPCSVVCPSVRRPSVRRPQFSKIFFSETAWPIKAKFYMKHLWEGGTNVYINNPGHMTKMAAMPIYGKNPSKIFSGTTGPISTKLGMKQLANGQNIEDSKKRKCPKGFICPCTGVKYDNIQTCLWVYAADLR